MLRGGWGVLSDGRGEIGDFEEGEVGRVVGLQINI